MKKLRVLPMIEGERGAVAIIVGLVVLFVGAGFAALAIDLGHLYVARNELQNAADAGALAGAQDLYLDEGAAINEDANDTAYTAAQRNLSEGVAVESDYVGGETNSGDIQRGHWSFGIGPNTTRGFYPSDSAAIIVLAGKSDEELDDMDGQGGRPVFINAVRVRARRKATPIVNFFAGAFGRGSSELSAEAVAYLGFAGTLLPGDVDQPIAICIESFAIDDETGEEYCNIGRMINSSNNVQTHNTAGWTDFTQAQNTEDESDPCQGGTNADIVTDLLETEEDGTTRPCGSGNPEIIYGGFDMATQGGEIQVAFTMLRDCWTSQYATNPVFDEEGEPVLDENGDPVRVPIDTFTGPTDQRECAGEPDCEPDPDGIPDVPWSLTLPTIICGDDNPGPCNKHEGAVLLEVVYISGGGTDPHYNDVPDHMGDWQDSNPDGELRWASFVNAFSLLNADGSDAPYAKKSIYFRPDCSRASTGGVTGGTNFGVLAEVPVLVK